MVSVARAMDDVPFAGALGANRHGRMFTLTTQQHGRGHRLAAAFHVPGKGGHSPDNTQT
jgi:hypothetical protein